MLSAMPTIQMDYASNAHAHPQRTRLESNVSVKANRAFIEYPHRQPGVLGAMFDRPISHVASVPRTAALGAAERKEAADSNC